MKLNNILPRDSVSNNCHMSTERRESVKYYVRRCEVGRYYIIRFPITAWLERGTLETSCRVQTVSSTHINSEKWILTAYNHRHGGAHRKYLTCNQPPPHCGLAAQVVPVFRSFYVGTSFLLLSQNHKPLLTSWKHVDGLPSFCLFL